MRSKITSNSHSYADMPTKLEAVVSLFERTGKSEAFGSVHAISVRIPTIEYSTIQALSEHAGISANKTIVELLSVALDEVYQQLDDENRDAVQAIRSRILGDFVKSEAFVQADKGEI